MMGVLTPYHILLVGIFGGQGPEAQQRHHFGCPVVHQVNWRLAIVCTHRRQYNKYSSWSVSRCQRRATARLKMTICLEVWVGPIFKYIFLFLYQLKNWSQPEQARLRTIAFKYDNSMLGLRYLQAPNRWTRRRRRPEIKLQELRKISFHQSESDIELLIPLHYSPWSRIVKPR